MKDSSAKTLLVVGLVAVSLFAPEVGLPALGVIEFI